MQPKWFRRLDVAVGHAVWACSENGTVGGMVAKIDDDGHYQVHADNGCVLRGVRREHLCLKWQVGGVLGPAAAASQREGGDQVCSRRRSNGVVPGQVSDSTVVPSTDEVLRLAREDRGRVDDTALLLRRDVAGRNCRARAVRGELGQDDLEQLPPCFHGLVRHLASPISGRTGQKVSSADYVNMLDSGGMPRAITLAIMRRKLGQIAKGKAPGFSCNSPDLYASLPDSWVEWAVELCNIVQFTQITPRGWHIDLVHYVQDPAYRKSRRPPRNISRVLVGAKK